MQVAAFHPSSFHGSSTPFSRPSSTAWAGASRSRDRSSRRMVAGFGPRTTTGEVRPSASHCRLADDLLWRECRHPRRHSILPLLSGSRDPRLRDRRHEARLRADGRCCRVCLLTEKGEGKREKGQGRREKGEGTRENAPILSGFPSVILGACPLPFPFCLFPFLGLADTGGRRENLPTRR
jgi:hypothetical protein